MDTSARKRVLVLSLSYYPRFVGGAEVAVKEIASRLPELEFHVLTLRYDSSLPKEEAMGNVVVHRIGFSSASPSIADLRRLPLRLNKFLYQLLAVPHALSLHRRYRFSAMWAMMAHSCGIPAGIVKTLKPELPYLLTLQEGDPPEAIERSMGPMLPLFRRGFRKADALQAISSFLAAWGVRMGFKGTPDVVPNGVDVARFSRPLSDAERASAKERIGPGTVLITASRLVPKNAVDDVIRALALLPETVSFAVCGIGPDEDTLKALAEELGVAGRVRFLGEASHEELPALLAASDAFVRPSRSEGMGNAFVEAMAAGIPVIGTAEGGIPDFLADGETGWVAKTGDPEDIARAAKAILARPEESARIAENAKRMVADRYDWDRIADEMRALFSRLMP